MSSVNEIGLGPDQLEKLNEFEDELISILQREFEEGLPLNVALKWIFREGIKYGRKNTDINI